MEYEDPNHTISLSILRISSDRGNSTQFQTRKDHILQKLSPSRQEILLTGFLFLPYLR